MPELLIELFSEEIPARMQVQAEADLARLLGGALKDAGLKFDAVKTCSTPRRLVAMIEDLPAKTPDVSEERRGPNVKAPEQAVEGFKRSLPEGAEVYEQDTPKGRFYFAKIQQKGRPTTEVLNEVIPVIIDKFSWPKSMRWGGGHVKWVRPLQSILCVFDEKVVEGLYIDVHVGSSVDEVKGEFKNFRFSNKTQGHRFMVPGDITVKDFTDYKAKLEKAYVLIDRDERKKRIEDGAKALAKKAGLSLVEDEGLLEEVTGLVEWPVLLLGQFDKAYLDLPSEILVAEMRNHQKYFALQDKDGHLSNHFIITANIEGDEKAIIAGNERVLGARLQDGKFFWDQDVKTPLENNLPKLNDIVFHEKLGTVADRVQRIKVLVEKLSHYVRGWDPCHAIRAAELCKADLVSGTVGEFPELQGVIGGYIAKAQGEDEKVATAIREHYQPQGPSDAYPSLAESVNLALADKLDTLISFFTINEKPTGSKDPFALRRAALGVIRIITENSLRYPLRMILGSDDLLAFFIDRLKVQQREAGVRHDLIDAAFATGEDDIVALLDQVKALADFIETDDGENLLTGYKRAANILAKEEKADGKTYAGDVDPALLSEDEEKALATALDDAAYEAAEAVDAEEYEKAMIAIAALRGPIDAFFDNVKVNDDDPRVRANRLNLLARIRGSLHTVADFSKIES